jgi:hypothetical protein
VTALGWLFMLSAWTVIAGVTAYCFWRVLSSEDPGDDS